MISTHGLGFEKKNRILKELRKNKNIVILRPDKGNGLVILDRAEYDGFFIFKSLTTLLYSGTLHPILVLSGKGNYSATLVNLGKKVTLIPTSMRLYGLPKDAQATSAKFHSPISPYSFLHSTFNYSLGKYLFSVISSNLIFHPHSLLQTHSAL